MIRLITLLLGLFTLFRPELFLASAQTVPEYIVVEIPSSVEEEPSQLSEVIAFEIPHSHIPSGSMCSICLEDQWPADMKVVKTTCEHLFHKDCFVPWIKSKLSCPYCRTPIRTYHTCLVTNGEQPRQAESAIESLQRGDIVSWCCLLSFTFTSYFGTFFLIAHVSS